MIREIHKNDFGEFEGTVWNELFQTDLTICFPGEADQAYAQQCAEYFSNLPQEMVDRLCAYCLRYCDALRNFFDEDEIEIPTGINGRDILSYITPSLLMAETHPNTDGIAFHVECGCAWEVEHGLEITISGERILYVGPYEGISPYNQARLESIGFYDEESDFSGNFADQE